MKRLSLKLREKWNAQPPKEKIWWIRSLTAIIASLVSTVIKPVLNPPIFELLFPSPASAVAALSGVLLFLILPFIFSHFLLKITPEEIGGWSPFFTSGIITAFFLWLTLWTAAYNILAA